MQPKDNFVVSKIAVITCFAVLIAGCSTYEGMKQDLGLANNEGSSRETWTPALEKSYAKFDQCIKSSETDLSAQYAFIGQVILNATTDPQATMKKTLTGQLSKSQKDAFKAMVERESQCFRGWADELTNLNPQLASAVRKFISNSETDAAELLGDKISIGEFNIQLDKHLIEFESSIVSR